MICFIKNRSKHSCNTLLSLLRIFMKQTLYLSHLFNQGTLHFSAGWIKCIAKKSEGKPRLEICPAVVQSYKTGGTTIPCRHIAQWPVFQEIILKLPKIRAGFVFAKFEAQFA